MQISGKYRCLKCGHAAFCASSTLWTCGHCGQAYACVRGMPKLYFDASVGAQDRNLRDRFYDGVFGAFYAFMMPFIVLPVRPLGGAWVHWLLYFAACGTLLLPAALGIWALSAGHAITAALALTAFGGLLWFLLRQRYLLDLLILAIPTKLSVAISRFEADESFAAVHQRAVASVASREGTLRILDVSTGSCNSLYKHGWMTLNATYTAIDLSATMLTKGQELMAQRGIAVDLVLGDALDLPFQSDSFDVVLNYGAINGMSDPQRALAEMTRVAKPGALLLFLDEQMYPNASRVERAYFHRVLSSHNVIHHCPVEWLPADVEHVRVAQVYEFYYICTATKRAALPAAGVAALPAAGVSSRSS
jgi:ubiquinone/menaquinone biosynthesis C-methylase UbiE